MHSSPEPLAQTRFDNAMALFDEFVRSNVKHADAATLRGLEGRFALRLQIQPSYWSQIKARSRQIGDRLARQFEQLSHKPAGWMDAPHGAGNVSVASPSAEASNLPQDDDERFIIGLVLTYYRRHPQRARARLLDLLGEVLTPARTPPTQAPPRRTRVAPSGSMALSARPADDAQSLWARARAAVAPLKRKR